MSKSKRNKAIYSLVFFLNIINSIYNINGVQFGNNDNSSVINCLYIGCLCNLNNIKCPAGVVNYSLTHSSSPSSNNQNDDVLYDYSHKLTMFPKRTSFLNTNYFVKFNNLTIDLSNNYLQMIPDDRFSSLSLHKLDLSQNLIHKLSPFVFRDINRLDVLDLSQNQVRFLSSQIFSPVENSLLILNLNNNELHDLETFRLTNSLNKLKKLQYLELSNNKLSSLPNLCETNSLIKLIARQNQIEILVDQDTYKPILPRSLINLNLEFNQIKYIGDNYFENLHQLKYLNLANNQISAIAETAFAHLINLIDLNLSKNNLKHIPSKIMYNLINLDYLDLSSQSQHIKLIDDYAFDRESNLKPIKLIKLNNNKISKIEGKAFCSRSYQREFVNIKELDLSFNPLVTVNSCNMRQLAKGFNYNSNSDADDNYFSTSSQSKVSFKTTTHIEYYNSNETYIDEPTLLNCDCELTKANRLVDLEGTCRRSDNLTFVSRIYDCGDHLSTNIKQINKYCSSLEQFECVPNLESTTSSSFKTSILWSKITNKTKKLTTSRTKTSKSTKTDNDMNVFTFPIVNLTNLSNWENNNMNDYYFNLTFIDDEKDDLSHLNETLSLNSLASSVFIRYSSNLSKFLFIIIMVNYTVYNF